MKEYILINRVSANHDRTDAQKVNDAWKNVTQKWEEDGIFVSSFVFPGEGYIHLIWRTNALNGKETAQGSFLKFTAHTFKKLLSGKQC